MKLMLIAGQSGAGLTTALGALEDLGYRAASGFPAELLGSFAACCMRQGSDGAVCSPVPGEKDAAAVLDAMEQLREDGVSASILYLEADHQVLINRYKFTRRPHPLSVTGVTTEQAILAERDVLMPLRAAADYKLDTSRLSARQLRETVLRIATGTQDQILSVNVVSFGFKYGIPADADLVLDVRFLPNPYYVPALRPKNGTDPQVRAYVFRDGTADDYMEKLCDMLDFLIPQYQREGKAVLTIAVGCTGGRHRSVAVAQALAEHVQHCGIPIAAVHRDWQKG